MRLPALSSYPHIHPLSIPLEPHHSINQSINQSIYLFFLSSPLPSISDVTTFTVFESTSFSMEFLIGASPAPPPLFCQFHLSRRSKLTGRADG